MLSQANETGLGVPSNWGIDLQNPISEVAKDVYDMHFFVLIIITLITLFVLALLLWVCYRYSEKNNKNPSKTVHNTLIEILWTAIPVLILVVIAIPSFKLLYKQEMLFQNQILQLKQLATNGIGAMNIQIIENFNYFMLQGEDEVEDGRPFKRMLTTDTIVVVPVNKIVRVQVTAADVLHSWAVPAFSVKTDAVPGRLNETWFKAEKTGIYYGMCSELCGVNHQSMPIEIHVVTEGEFAEWVAESQKKYANNNKILELSSK